MPLAEQGCRRFDAVQVNHLTAGQCRQVAAFADFIDQMAQHGMARAVKNIVEQQVLGQATQARARAVVTAVGTAL